MRLENLDGFGDIIQPILKAVRIPGAAIAVVVGDELVFSRAYGYRDLSERQAITSQTLYPIASTTKSINATLIGMLVDDGRLSWDEPVQSYVPDFRLGGALVSSQVTLRDLLCMRTGLPRHDWMWNGRAIERPELVRLMRHLELSSPFRERFQYNNLTATAAGYVAEVVTGRSWEDLVQERILTPLGMRHSTFSVPTSGNFTRSYHDSDSRELLPTEAMAAHATMPSGGGLHSTIEDMARWIAFNLSGGRAQGRQLIQPRTLEEIRAPQIGIGSDQSPPTAGATRALGWTIDRYQGFARVAHAGYLWDVSSDVSLYPERNVGLVAFNNFGCVWRAKLINQCAFEVLMGLPLTTQAEQKIAEYEHNVEQSKQRSAAVRRVVGTTPSHPLSAYIGSYTHPAYGSIEIGQEGADLKAQFNGMLLTLEHWHYDAWVVAPHDIFELDAAHAFDRTNRWLFETNADGVITSIRINLEPAVRPILFEKVPTG